MLPNALVDGLEVNLVQAGHPHGLDLPRILGIKITLAAMAALLLLVTARCCWPLIAAAVALLPARLLGAERAGQAPEPRCRPTPPTSSTS